jgi:hypothetical protein
MNPDYAQWSVPADSADAVATTLTVDALVYEVLRLRVGPASDGVPARPRFRDVAVTGREGVQRFVAGYSMLAGPVDLASPLQLTGHAPVAGLVHPDPADPGAFVVSFPGASPLQEVDGLVVLDNGFGFRGPAARVDVSDAGIEVTLESGSELLLVGGPWPSKITNRWALVRTDLALLPSY